MRKLICIFLAVVCLCGTVAAYGPPESFEGKSLEQVMTEYMEERGLSEKNFSMAYFNTVTGETYNFNEEQFTIAGSCYRVPLNLYFYEMERNGEITPDTVIGETGRTLAEIREESILNCNNQLSEALMYYWGDHQTYKENIRKYFTMTDEEIKPDYYNGNYFCVRMMMDCLRYLYTNQEQFPELIDRMKQEKPGEFFQKGVMEYEVAHSFGAVQQFFNDVGIIYTPQPYLLAVFTQYINNDEVCAEVAELTAAYTVWQSARTPAQLQEEGSEEVIPEEELPEEELPGEVIPEEVPEEHPGEAVPEKPAERPIPVPEQKPSREQQLPQEEPVTQPVLSIWVIGAGACALGALALTVLLIVLLVKNRRK